MENKTEKPTPKRLRDARKKGQISKSKELILAVTALALFVGLYILGGVVFDQMTGLIEKSLVIFNEPFSQAVSLLGFEAAKALWWVSFGFGAIAVVSAIFANISHSGFVFSIDPVKPDMNKINPVNGVKNLVTWKNLIELIKSMIKVLVLTWFVYYLIRYNLADLFQIPYCGVSCILPTVGHVIMEFFFYCILCFAVMAAFDTFYQRAEFLRQMRMSVDEIKKEHKEVEGNVEVKRRRFELYQDLINQSLSSDVQGSSVVVTNPTHLAIGIYYETGKVKLPVVVFKEKGDVAQAVKRMAKEHGVPVMENVPLARGLMSKADVNQYIPSEFIVPVVEVLKWVKTLKRDGDDPAAE